jgi:hypothetical protein
MERITTLSQLTNLIRSNDEVIILDYKKKDGSSRDIHCTLNFDSIPKEKYPTAQENRKIDNFLKKGYVVVFDIEKNDWRSLISGKILKCKTKEVDYIVKIEG